MEIRNLDELRSLPERSVLRDRYGRVVEVVAGGTKIVVEGRVLYADKQTLTANRAADFPMVVLYRPDLPPQDVLEDRLRRCVAKRIRLKRDLKSLTERIQFDDTADRLRRAVARLEEKRSEFSEGRTEYVRLSGKIEGVKLAASYMAERVFLPKEDR